MNLNFLIPAGISGGTFSITVSVVCELVLWVVSGIILLLWLVSGSDELMLELNDPSESMKFVEVWLRVLRRGRVLLVV